MKKILSLLILSFAIHSCSVDQEEQPIYTYSVLPIDSVIMPTVFAVDISSEIKIKYLNTSMCNQFNGFYYDKKDFTRIVGIEIVSINAKNCTKDATLIEKTLTFTPIIAGTYTFKFYSGEDRAGVNQYNIQTVVVP